MRFLIESINNASPFTGEIKNYWRIVYDKKKSAMCRLQTLGFSKELKLYLLYVDTKLKGYFFHGDVNFVLAFY